MTSIGSPAKRTRMAALALIAALMIALASSQAEAASRQTSLQIVPTITNISIKNGGLVATGQAVATIKGKTYSAPFTAPVNIALAANQSAAAAAGCPILDLTLGPINLNLLGLDVSTSPICLTVTAYSNGGLLGQLLCDVADLLNGGLNLSQILSGQSVLDPLGNVLVPGLTSGQISSLLSGLTNLLNSALGQLYNAVLQTIQAVNSGHTCAILHLALGPVDLTLLGLNVHLDNCNNGPVTVDITAITGQGNLLGNLLCELVDGSLLNIGATLQGILNQLLGLLNV